MDPHKLFQGDFGGSKTESQTGHVRPQKVLFIVFFLSLFWDVRGKGRVTSQTSRLPRLCCAAGYDEPPNKLKSGMLGGGHNRTFTQRRCS